MNTAFERTENSSNEWYTPREIVDALGTFDLDPCAPKCRLWDTAKKHLTKEDDGLSQEWHGRVWLNPPYSRPLVGEFITKMAKYGNGIALVFNRLDTELFQSQILNKATAILIIKGRIKFYRPDGTRGGSPGCGSVLVAYGHDNATILKNCGIQGKYIELQSN